MLKNESVEAMNNLANEIKALREQLHLVSRIMDKWDADGMPSIREIDNAKK